MERQAQSVPPPALPAPRGRIVKAGPQHSARAGPTRLLLEQPVASRASNVVVEPIKAELVQLPAPNVQLEHFHHLSAQPDLQPASRVQQVTIAR